MTMKSLLAAAMISLGLAAPAAPAMAQSEQQEVYQARKNGRVMPLREIENRILPRMRGFSYLGPEFDSGSAVYRLKFMKGASVVWVDIDARTGAVIGRSGR